MEPCNRHGIQFIIVKFVMINYYVAGNLQMKMLDNQLSVDVLPI